MRKTIVLATDKNYLDKALVTIKSVSVYNRDVDFYLFHQGEVPTEWIRTVNYQLKQLGSTLKNVIISNRQIERFQTFLTASSWLRLFIPEFVLSDKVLYLDSDVIVNTNLDDLFALDLKEDYIAAVQDPNKNESGNFNSGVMLINASLWREQGLTDKLLRTAEAMHHLVRNGDQSILNIVCDQKWLALDKTYNYQTYDVVSRYEHRAYLYEDLKDAVPRIVHFLTSDKPWNSYSVARFRELWWYYFQLEFSQMDEQRQKPVSYEEAMATVVYSDKNIFILTETDQLEQIGFLIESLPDYQFHIAAYTMVSEKLSILASYDNVLIYPEIIDARVEKLLKYCDIYLDINHYAEVRDIVSRAHQLNKVILAFDTTAHHPQLANQIISSHEPEKMVDFLKQITIP